MLYFKLFDSFVLLILLLYLIFQHYYIFFRLICSINIFFLFITFWLYKIIDFLSSFRTINFKMMILFFPWIIYKLLIYFYAFISLLLKTISFFISFININFDNTYLILEIHLEIVNISVEIYILYLLSRESFVLDWCVS